MKQPLLRYVSSNELTLRSAVQQPGKIKPNGLWVSVGSAWKEWCEGEDFCLTSLRYCFKVNLAEHANIVRLAGAAALNRFTKEFGCDPPFTSMAGPHPAWTGNWIDWREVAASYQGIIIDPYCYTRRLELFWYYGWDCASGCIWDTRAIQSVELLEEVQQHIGEPASTVRHVDLD